MKKLIIPIFLLACEPQTKTTIVTESSIEELSDLDGDGYFSDEDCDDSSILIHPNAEEVCDGLDNNCDGEIDEGVKSLFYLDQDGDGFGIGDSSIEACDAPESYVPNNHDCDDENEYVYPSAEELCDEIDNDCNGEIDENFSGLWYADQDGDGFGDSENLIAGCQPDSSWVEDNTDCDDSDSEIHPSAEEFCDGVDNNCDGEIDEDSAIDALMWYQDADQDGFGNPDEIHYSCELVAGYIDNSDDCNDFNNTIHPDADEYCNEIDDDCDGQEDEDSPIGSDTYYQDLDQDGFGDPNNVILACIQPLGTQTNSDDCNDSDTSIYLGALEICDGQDNACAGQIPSSESDDDGDGYVECFIHSSGWDGASISGDEDCNDSDITVYPNATELCDGLPNSCQGSLPVDETDLDGDGYVLCSIDSGGWDGSSAVIGGDDCDNSDVLTHPFAGFLESNSSACMTDGDGDGYGSEFPLGNAVAGTDCDDADANLNPGPGICPEGESCNDILFYDALAASGSYVIDPDGTGGLDPFEVYCDMTTDSGGWTLIEAYDIQNKEFYATKTFHLDDMARSGDSPNWDDYRLSLGRTQALMGLSTQVHTRCHRDYVSSLNDYLFGDIGLITQSFNTYYLDVWGVNPYNVSAKIRGYDASTFNMRWYQGSCCGNSGYWHAGSDVSGQLPNYTPSEDSFTWHEGVLNTNHLCHTSAGEIVWMVR